jgi:hypothetical protein
MPSIYRIGIVLCLHLVCIPSLTVVAQSANTPISASAPAPTSASTTVAAYIEPVEVAAGTPVAPPTTLPHSYCISDQNCLNGGVCALPDAESLVKHCHCPAGVTGHRCEHYCPLACENQGHCYAVDGGPSSTFSDPVENPTTHYACKCLGYFQGKLCETPYQNCADKSRCLNGGQCRLVSTTGTESICECPPGYGGASCEQQVPIESSVSEDASHNSSSSSSSVGSNIGETFSTTLISDRFERLMQQRALSLAAIAGCIMFLTGILAYLLARRRRRGTLRRYDEVLTDIDSMFIEYEPKWRNVV